MNLLILSASTTTSVRVVDFKQVINTLFQQPELKWFLVALFVVVIVAVVVLCVILVAVVVVSVTN